MKRKYDTPEMKIMEMPEDVITTSGQGDDPVDPGRLEDDEF